MVVPGNAVPGVKITEPYGGRDDDDEGPPHAAKPCA